MGSDPSQLALLKWYEGVSCSEKIYYAIKGSTLASEDFRKDSLEDFIIDRNLELDREKLGKLCGSAINLYTEALEISPHSAWFHYARGCERVMWGDAEERRKGIRDVIRACELLEDIKDYLGDEEYLTKSVDDEEIKMLIEASNE